MSLLVRFGVGEGRWREKVIRYLEVVLVLAGYHKMVGTRTGLGFEADGDNLFKILVALEYPTTNHLP